MVPLSLGWSAGALLCGQLINREREKGYALFGSFLLIGSTALTVSFSSATPVMIFSSALAVAGIGMGFVSVATLLIVQNSLDAANLGVATSAQQFARTLGGTIGIGISGSLAIAHLSTGLESLLSSSSSTGIPPAPAQNLLSSFESIFQPEIQAGLSPIIQRSLVEAVGKGVRMVFWSSLAAALVSLVCCWFIPGHRKAPRKQLG